MKTRTGKIARLPAVVREELNGRLEAAEPGRQILPWLNSLPAVRTLLDAEFAGVPISKHNLSDWRQGGFLDWRARQDLSAGIAQLPDLVEEFAEAGPTRAIDSVATILAVHFAGLLAHWNGRVTPEFEAKSRALNTLCQGVNRLQVQANLDRREKVALLTASNTTACEKVESSRTQSNHETDTAVQPSESGNAVANSAPEGNMSPDNFHTQR